MPPKPNGFYMFMLGEQKKFKAQTNRAPSMKEMPGLCKDAWKRLTADEKAHFESLAKKEKAKLQNSDISYAKLDCHRQVIADRKDPVKEENKRRISERQRLQGSWTGQETRDIVFHILDFQVMYDDIMEDQHFPLEIGMISFTLRKGILNFLHRFIDPGEVPQGNRHLAISHSEQHHQIPLNFEHADGNFKALTEHVAKFLRSDSEKDELPPVFCLSIHRHLAENCLDYIYQKVFVREADKIRDVFCLEDLVIGLIANTGKGDRSVAESQVHDMLLVNRWDYNSSIRCFYHEELDCSFCSLSIVRRYGFAMFDVLANLMDFKLTEKHMPDEMEQVYTVTPAVGFGRSSNNAGAGDRNQMPNYNRADHGRNRYQSEGSNRSWEPPKVQPVKVPVGNGKQEDDDDDSDGDSDDEIKPQPAVQQPLGKMRLPKSLAQAQTQVGQMSLQDNSPPPQSCWKPAANPQPGMPNVPGSSAIRPMGRGLPPVRMGRGMSPMAAAQMRPSARAFPPPVNQPPPGIQPPPGFGPRPGLSSSSQAYDTVMNEHFPALNRGRGLARGRLPCQD